MSAAIVPETPDISQTKPPSYNTAGSPTDTPATDAKLTEPPKLSFDDCSSAEKEDFDNAIGDAPTDEDLNDSPSKFKSNFARRLSISLRDSEVGRRRSGSRNSQISQAELDKIKKPIEPPSKRKPQGQSPGATPVKNKPGDDDDFDFVLPTAAQKKAAKKQKQKERKEMEKLEKEFETNPDLEEETAKRDSPPPSQPSPPPRKPSPPPRQKSPPPRQPSPPPQPQRVSRRNSQQSDAEKQKLLKPKSKVAEKPPKVVDKPPGLKKPSAPKK